MKLYLVIVGLICCLFTVYSCSNDNESPTVSIISPQDNDTIRIHTTVISADANDNNEVEYVEFNVGLQPFRIDYTSPYEVNWSISKYVNMEIVPIQVVACDPSHNLGGSDIIAVFVVTRGMVSDAYTDTVIIFDGTYALCDITMSDAPDSAVVDSITVFVSIFHQQISDVDVLLQSPSGTEHQLWDNDFSQPTDTITTALFADEEINGTWILRIFDEVNNGLGGFATDFNIEIYWKF